MTHVTARREGQRIIVRAPFELKDTCKQIPGANWDRTFQAWVYPATPEVAGQIRSTFHALDVRLTGNPEMIELVKSAREAEDARALKGATDLPDTPGKSVAWLHQRQAHHFAAGQSGALLGIAPGGGKSRVTIGLLEEWQAQRVLIICPRSVLDVWPDQFAQHAERQWNAVALYRGTVSKRTTVAKDAVVYADQIPTALIINYEACWREPFKAWSLKQHWDVVVCDEGHRLRNPGGVASRHIGTLGKRAKRRLGLTGTPMSVPTDIYAQARFLDPGHFGTSFARFKQRYCVLGGFQNREVVGWANQDELAERISRFAFMYTSEQLDAALDLPETQDLQRRTDLDEARPIYDQVANDLIADIGNGTVTAGNALTRLLRLLQITGGAVGDDEGNAHVVGTEKRKLLLDVLADIGEPVVCFARFRHDLDVIRATAEELNRRYGELSGRDRGGMDGPRMREGVDVLGVQIASGGVGIDLTRARHVIFYSLGFSLLDWEQARKRVHRPGQTRKTWYTHLICRGTVDEVVYKALAAKADVVGAVIQAVKEASP